MRRMGGDFPRSRRGQIRVLRQSSGSSHPVPPTRGHRTFPVVHKGSFYSVFLGLIEFLFIISLTDQLIYYQIFGLTTN